MFRTLGVIFSAVGILWMLEAGGKLTLPGAQGVARLEGMALGQGGAHDYADAQESTTRALAWAPLDWELYYIRAAAGVGRRHDLEATEADFRRARFLERCSPSAPMDEARAWAAARQDPQAVNALLEACRRVPSQAADFIGAIYLLRLGDAEFVDLLGAAVLREPALEVAASERLEGMDLAGFVARVLQSDPDLSRLDNAQKTRFFRAWATKGDAQTLASGMALRPAWQVLGWRWWAEARGRAATPEAWQEACKIVAPRAPAPDVPPANDPRTFSQLQRDAVGASDDAALALALYRAQRANGDSAGALLTLRRATDHPDIPAYFSYLEAQLAMETGQWETGWEAWRRYLVLVAANG